MKITAADLAVALRALQYLSTQHLDIQGIRWEDLFNTRVNIDAYLRLTKVEVEHE